MTRNRKHVSLTLDKGLVERIDARRGYIPRSIFIEQLVRGALERGLDRILIRGHRSKIKRSKH